MNWTNMASKHTVTGLGPKDMLLTPTTIAAMSWRKRPRVDN